MNIDNQTLEGRVLSQLANDLHLKEFPEEYDYCYDSIADAKDRQNGTNPMSQAYTDEVNERRKSKGVSPLGNDGFATDDSSLRYALTTVKSQFNVHRNKLGDYLYHALCHVDPARVGANHASEMDKYLQVSNATLQAEKKGDVFSAALRQALVSIFGKKRFARRRLNLASLEVSRVIADWIGDNWKSQED